MKHNPKIRLIIIWIPIVLTLLMALIPSSVALAQEPTDSGQPTDELRAALASHNPLTRLEAVLSQTTLQNAGSTKSLKKMDSSLHRLLADHLQRKDVAESATQNDLHLDQTGRLLLDIYVTNPLREAVPLLQGHGLEVKATDDHFGVVAGYLPLDSVLAVANLSYTKALMPVTGFGLDVGSVTSQGDGSHNGPTARALGTDGAGVVVGVISDAMDTVGTGLAGSQGLGDLPANVIILNEPPSGIDEGRAMAEIIYDMAPGISTFYFASGTDAGATGKANAIDNLVANGVDIIADDIYYISEPFFQDGVISQAVDRAREAGVSYFASAGNRARQSYESDYQDSAGFHDFDSGAGVDTIQRIVDVPNGRYLQISLHWDNPSGAATHDFDAFLVDVNNPMTILAWATTDNIATGLPRELPFYFNNSGGTVQVGLMIERFFGTGDSFLKYIARGNFGAFTIAEHNTASDAINPDAASASSSIATAAIIWNESGLNDPEPFSSRGPKTRLFDKDGNRLAVPEVRQKPEVAGADGVITSATFSNNQPFGGGAFFGTSASTPGVAGVAALVKSARPGLTPDFMRTILTNPANTIDCTLAGNPDNDCGYGFVLADSVVSQAQTILLPTTLSIGKQTAALAFSGAPLTYTIAITNSGTEPAAGIVITDTVPASATLVAASLQSDGTATDPTPGSLITWDTGAMLAPSQSLTRTFVITVDEGLLNGGQIINTAYVTATNAAIASDTTITAIAAPKLALTKLVTLPNPPRVKPGESITYTLTLANQGEVDASAVRVTDTLPSGVSGVNLDTTVTVTAGQSVTLVIPATVAAPFDATITNTAYYTHPSGAGQDQAAFTVYAGVFLPIVIKK